MKEKKFEEMTELKRLIKKKNYSYRVMAKEMNISLDAFNNKINGYTAINLREAEKLIEILGISGKDVNRYFFGKCCETQQKGAEMHVF
ncbi:MAG: helix-turn-helix transcriptional regulator [Firmicutes bacterium]|nr:helix-turn-helix transcriptional regulator [Bacillota bacterium]